MIIGLDPAGPGFHSVKKQYRLDESDARLVLDVHTNAGEVNSLGLNVGAGILQPSGHYSFYVNGGKMTYGCASKSVQLLRMIGTFSCSHSYSTLLMSGMETKSEHCSPVAYRCHSYHEYVQGQCFNCINPEDCLSFHSFFSKWIEAPQFPPSVCLVKLT